MKQRCKQCDLPMFRYTFKHNGKMKSGYRCLSIHGTRDLFGNHRKLSRGKAARGVRKVFQSLITYSGLDFAAE